MIAWVQGCTAVGCGAVLASWSASQGALRDLRRGQAVR
jgi:hypothetical protein